MKNVNLLGKLIASCCSIALFLMLSVSFSASAQQKVVGGVDVDIKDYPWQVALTSSPSGSGFCGGSIIGDSWILTAAHCVNGTSASGLYIRCGASASFASGGDSYSVNQIIVHPSYSGNSYDFALVEINGEFAYNSNVQKIDLIDEAEIAAGAQDGGVMSTITGWGTTSSGGSLASVLQMVEAPIVNNDVACGSANDSNGNSGQYPCSSLDASMICAGDLINGGEDACQGDSGGPLAVRSSDDSRWLLIGATSWGYGCADVIYPGVWSKVSYVLDWINDNADVDSEFGCMDASACNYSEEAIYDNGSCAELDECGDCGGNGPAAGYDCDGNCTTGETLVVTMSDSYGDGWNGNNIVVNGTSLTIGSGSSGSGVVCYDSAAGCVDVTCDGGSWQEEVSWTIADADGNVLLSGGAPFVGAFGAEGCGPVYGCTDDTSLNYDAEATADDGSCLYPVAGCMDSLALNYNADAIEDDGSCTYPIDCSGLTYVNIEVGGGSWATEVSWEMNGLQGQAGSTEACLEDGCYIFNMYDSFGDGWNGNTVNVFAGEDILLTGTLDSGSEGVLSFSLNYDGECGPVYGCTDSLALNFDPLATANDNSCLYPTLGCTDSLALNYNELATEDDGSCTYPIDCEGLTAIMIEVGGGSYDSEISWELNGLEGVSGSTESCLENGCYTFNMEDSYGDGWNGATVSIATATGEALVSGTLEAGTSGALMFSYNEDCGYVNGCTDSLALNFDPIATINDGSCEYEQGACDDGYVLDCNGNCAYETWIGDGLCDDGSYAVGGVDIYFNCEEFGNDGGDCENVVVDSLGCTDPNASNYNPNAFADDGSCVYDVESGCTDAEALNYNPNAIEDDGSCEYPIDCEGLTTVMIDMSDSFGDGWNGNVLTMNGQSFTIESGSESSATACYNSDGGDCAYVSCDGGLWQSEVSWTISDIDGNVLLSGGAPFDGAFGGEDCGPISGCTDPSAVNYNELATDDDGSCEYVASGCTDIDALNYDSEAIEDDGSCVYETECTGYLAMLTVNSVAYGTEHTWSITDANGATLYDGGQYANNTENTIELCLDADASYSMSIMDTYGDGWNGGTFSISTSNCELVSGGLEQGQIAEFDFTASCDDPCASVECQVGYECVNGDCILIETSAPWEMLITGSNHTIVIDGEATIDLNDMSIEIGDALGVFFTDDNGDLQCGGFAYWTGSTNSIAAQGDDTTTDEIDGFTAGSSFVWMMWDATENMVYAANATYSAAMPNQGEYTTNGISALAALATMPAVSEQVISMPTGWSIFSTYMVAENMDMADVLAPIYDDLVIAKNNAGLAYLPEWNFNGVGDLVLGQAYQIKLNNANDLTIVGTYMAPEENPIALTAGWNMIGYLRIESADAAAVLSEIYATGNLVIAKDYNGQAYLPEWDFNGIGDMKPGEGYQLKINNDDVLTYLSNDDSYRMSTTEVTNNSPVYFEKVMLTDNNMTIVIEDAVWDVLPTVGSEIAAFDKAGNLIGSATYTSPVTVLTVWGDDATTNSKDGLVASEAVAFKVWSNNQTDTFEVSKWIEGSSTYSVDAINVASSIITTNSLTNTISTERVLVKVINVLGQEVTAQDAFKGEVLFNVYNDGTVEKVVR
ncbi:MAG: trypsin-like serine protease [Flavobacteriales bacterium]